MNKGCAITGIILALVLGLSVMELWKGDPSFYSKHEEVVYRAERNFVCTNYGGCQPGIPTQVSTTEISYEKWDFTPVFILLCVICVCGIIPCIGAGIEMQNDDTKKAVNEEYARLVKFYTSEEKEEKIKSTKKKK